MGIIQSDHRMKEAQAGNYTYCEVHYIRNKYCIYGVYSGKDGLNLCVWACGWVGGFFFFL